MTVSAQGVGEIVSRRLAVEHASVELTPQAVDLRREAPDVLVAWASVDAVGPGAASVDAVGPGAASVELTEPKSTEVSVWSPSLAAVEIQL